jgi:hypothetical protein
VLLGNLREREDCRAESKTRGCVVQKVTVKYLHADNGLSTRAVRPAAQRIIRLPAHPGPCTAHWNEKKDSGMCGLRQGPQRFCAFVLDEYTVFMSLIDGKVEAPFIVPDGDFHKG